MKQLLVAAALAASTAIAPLPGNEAQAFECEQYLNCFWVQQYDSNGHATGMAMVCELVCPTEYPDPPTEG